ncbi:MAG: diacylglycerol kinase family lipid kinase [Chloroflexi bacterium]|nr:diacylglycerol kinase family lipid kinase [Chloroflexota bacterium]
MADKARIKLIINPNADMGKAWRQASDLRPLIEGHGNADWAGTVYPTHAIELARQAAEDGYDIVIAIGGDGTAHEVINGLMQVPKEKRPKFGVVPMGSGNDFAHALGMPENREQALKHILNGKTKRIDIGTIEDEHGRLEYWDNSLSIGFGGAVTIYSHSMPILRGFLMYFVAVLQTIIKNYDVLKMKITTEEKSWEDELMMLAVCNGPREGGGFITAPSAKNDDGIFNYTAVKKISRLMMFRLVPEFMRGTHGKFKSIEMGILKKMEISSNRSLYLHVDGEVFAGFATDIRQLKIEMLPNALEVLVPQDA